MLVSTILLLQEYCFAKSGGPASSSDDLFPEAKVTLDDLDAMVISFRRDYVDKPDILDSVSLFLTQMTYQTASMHIRLSGGQPNASKREHINIHKDLLQRLSPRWRVACRCPIFLIEMTLILLKPFSLAS